jgi:predicted transcriptional regulator
MSVITVEIPDVVRAALDATARREHKSAEQVAGESLARAVQAQQQLDYLAERAKRGRREHFEAFLAKVPDAPPMPGDEL